MQRLVVVAESLIAEDCPMPDRTCSSTCLCLVAADRLEKRSTPRYRFVQDLICHFRQEGRSSARWARVRDLSAGGIGLVVSGSVPCGERLSVQLRLRNRRHRFPVRVVHVSDRGNGTSFVGCAFEALGEPDSLAAASGIVPAVLPDE